MATQFEFRLVNGEAPEGELEADQLIAIVQSLKDVATRLGRAETDAEAVGRPPKRTQRVARLTIGLAPGSTKVLVRRAEDEGTLDFGLEEEEAFDEKFQSIVESIAVDKRPDWVSNSLAIAAGDLRSALEKAAPIVEFKIDGKVRRTFRTSETRKNTWLAVEAERGLTNVTFVGRLRAVNLDTHRLQVTDDVGNKVALPNVLNGAKIGRLLDAYVAVVGLPEHDVKGRLIQIHEATIEASIDPLAGGTIPDSVPLEAIMATGPKFGGIQGLTDDEADAFLDALGL